MFLREGAQKESRLDQKRIIKAFAYKNPCQKTVTQPEKIASGSRVMRAGNQEGTKGNPDISVVVNENEEKDEETTNTDKACSKDLEEMCGLVLSTFEDEKEEKDEHTSVKEAEIPETSQSEKGENEEENRAR